MAEQGFTLTSPAFPEGAAIPASFTCEGQNRMPTLEWMHAPESTKSFALIVDDPDAPNGLFTHWLLFDIPATTTSLHDGERSVGIAGRNDFQKIGYGGPCPPPNHGDHRYYFKLFAVDTETLNLPEGATRKEIDEALQGHVLETAELMGRFQRGSHAHR